MEAVAVAKALKPSLRREFMVQEMLRKDSGNTVACGEDFSVDELFDFSNSALLYEQQEYDEDKASLTASSQSQDREEGDSSSNSTYDTLIPTELAIPVQGDELEDLEWVSHFVDDCVPIWLEEEKGAGKKRKKARTVGNRKAKEGVWRWVPEKKAQIERRCSHCEVKKTPQWRKGPMGPKTLCNACGVRYKLGRLFWEYRPACSPTFCRDIHSNSHRKVMEIRKLKGVAASPHP